GLADGARGVADHERLVARSHLGPARARARKPGLVLLAEDDDPNDGLQLGCPSDLLERRMDEEDARLAVVADERKPARREGRSRQDGGDGRIGEAQHELEVLEAVRREDRGPHPTRATELARDAARDTIGAIDKVAETERPRALDHCRRIRPRRGATPDLLG